MASPAVRTTCPYCGVGCGVVARPQNSGVEISGDPKHPANYGKLCVKGAALGETHGLETRLLHPLISLPRAAGEGQSLPRTRSGGGGGAADDKAPPPQPSPAARGRELRRASWDEALDFVASRFNEIIAQHGPDAVAFYVSGQLLTEDYYVANKLMKGFIGSANIDTNSRLCMSSAVAGHRRAFGEDLVPVCYADLDLADLIVLVGSNTAWCHPVLYQRIEKARAARPQMRVVVIDPRHTATCGLADLHLPVRPGTDVWLFNGLLHWLHRHGVMDAAFVEVHTAGLEAALAAAARGPVDVAGVAAACGVEAGALEAFYRLFARTANTVTAFSQGVNQSSAGTDKVNSIINCHLLTGRIGKPGAGPFSITGQPNAMGGREVGGLANMLAAHMELAHAGHRAIVQEFWRAPRLAEKPGLKAVELFDAIHDGRVKAVWIMATNPVVSLPDADKVKAALQRCPLVVVSDVVARTDTSAFAHVLLPAAAWGEKDGTVTNSERMISRQRAFRPLPGEAQPDWQIICELARRMGFGEGFNFSSAHEVFDEHARLSAFRNGGARCFDLGGLAGLSAAQFDALAPTQWPVESFLPPLAGEGQDGGSRGGEMPPPQLSVGGRPDLHPARGGGGTKRLFTDGRFFHADGRARFVPTPPRAPVHAPDDEFPLVLNTGRVRDHWHTMTRTGLAPRLATHTAEPFVELHAQDALLWGVREGELARVSSRWGSMVVRVQVGAGMRRGEVFVPIHWNGQFASDARVGGLVNPVVDPVSGEPEFKHTPVRVEPFAVQWYGFVLTRGELGAALAMPDYWARVTGAQFTRFELAGRGVVAEPRAWARALLSVEDAADWLEYEDRSAGVYRAAALCEGRIDRCVYLSPRPDLPSRAWLGALFTKAKLTDADRAGLLLGEPLDAAADAGPTVCSCFGVGRNTIVATARQRGCTEVGQITATLKAGGNCGSCVPEIRRLLAELRAAA